MLKYLSAVVLSVVLSVSAVFAIHSSYQTSKAQAVAAQAVDNSAALDQIKSSTHKLTGIMVDMFGMYPYSCSSVSIDKNIVLTAAHCNGNYMKVDGKDAKVLKVDEKNDLLLLYVDVGGTFVPVAKDEVKVGEVISTYGYPLGLFVGFVPVYTEGYVSGFVDGVKEYGTDFLTGRIMAVLPIIGGNSGGGIYRIVKGKAEVVSVVSLGAGHISISPSVKMIQEFLNK